MADVHKYKVWCEVEQTWKFTWRDSDEGDPTVCPNNGHAIDPSKTSIVESRLDADKRNPDGSLPVRLSSPEEKDGKPVLTISPSDISRRTYFTSCGDDMANPNLKAGIGEGPAFILKFEGTGQLGDNGHPDGPNAASEDKEVTFQFNSPVEFHDGQISWRELANFSPYDHAYLNLRMPPTQFALVGPPNGNCILMPVPGLGNICVPYGNGSHLYDLANCVPVPAPDGGGYFNVDRFTGEVTLANIVQVGADIIGDGEFHLFDTEIVHRVVNKLSLGSPLGVFDIDAYRVEWAHPSWEFIFGARKFSPGSGFVLGWMLLFR